MAGYSPNDVTVGAEKDWFGQGHVSFSTYLYNVTVNVTPSACCCAASSRLCSCLCSILRLFATACADNRLSFCFFFFFFARLIIVSPLPLNVCRCAVCARSAWCVYMKNFFGGGYKRPHLTNKNPMRIRLL